MTDETSSFLAGGLGYTWTSSTPCGGPPLPTTPMACLCQVTGQKRKQHDRGEEGVTARGADLSEQAVKKRKVEAEEPNCPEREAGPVDTEKVLAVVQGDPLTAKGVAKATAASVAPGADELYLGCDGAHPRKIATPLRHQSGPGEQ